MTLDLAANIARFVTASNDRIEVDGDRKVILRWRDLPDGTSQLLNAWPW